MAQGAFATFALIYHQTVYQLRASNRNAIVGLLLIISQSLLMVVLFLAMYKLIGIRGSPVRGDFLLFIMSGIFIFMTHVKTVAAVASSYSLSSAMVKHQPLNPAILICAAALSILYQQIIACTTILTFYHVAFSPVEIYNWQGVMAMLVFSWFLGCCIGLVFLGIKPWAPKMAPLITMAYTRLNMVASGKMFLANSIPGFLFPWFSWNPLFHIIDQSRGFMFINYSPKLTNLLYPIFLSIGFLMIGLLINFTTRKYESASWASGQ